MERRQVYSDLLGTDAGRDRNQKPERITTPQQISNNQQYVTSPKIFSLEEGRGYPVSNSASDSDSTGNKSETQPQH